MIKAKCTIDNFTYTAVEFAQLQPNELEHKRRFLQCPACGGPAFFRHAAMIGRGPCFGARPHADGCELAAYDYADGANFDSDITRLQVPQYSRR